MPTEHADRNGLIQNRKSHLQLVIKLKLVPLSLEKELDF